MDVAFNQTCKIRYANLPESDRKKFTLSTNTPSNTD